LNEIGLQERLCPIHPMSLSKLCYQHLILLLSISQLNAEPEPIPISAGFHNGRLKQTANAELPRFIKKQIDGDLHLIADKSADRANGVPVYLINATSAPVSLPTQDNDIYLKLEVKDTLGNWQRAQAHASASCGNSYNAGILQPGCHFKLHGYQPDSGEKGTVRFSIIDQNLTTNELLGRFSSKDIKDSQEDLLSVRDLSYPIIDPLYLSKTQGTESLISDPKRVAAIKRAMVLWKKYGPVPWVSMRGAKLVENLEQAAAKDEAFRPLALEIKERYDAPFHPKASPSILALFSLKQLDKVTDKSSAAGWAYRTVLSRLCETNSIKDSLQLEIFRQSMTHQLMPQCFEEPHKIDEIVPNNTIWNSLKIVTHPPVRTQLWRALIRRGLRDKVLESCSQANLEERMVILDAFAQAHKGNETPQRGFSKEEKALWYNTAKNLPLNVARLIAEINPRSLWNFTFLRDPFREFIEKEVSRWESDQAGVSVKGTITQWKALLQTVDKMDETFDLPLWQKLAQSHAYLVIKHSSWEEGKMMDIVEHCYWIRTYAAKILKKHGHPAPASLPEKKVISRTPSKENEKP